MLKNIDILDLRIKGDEGYRLCETLSIVNNDIDNLCLSRARRNSSFSRIGTNNVQANVIIGGGFGPSSAMGAISRCTN